MRLKFTVELAIAPDYDCADTVEDEDEVRAYYTDERLSQAGFDAVLNAIQELATEGFTDAVEINGEIDEFELCIKRGEVVQISSDHSDEEEGNGPAPVADRPAPVVHNRGDDLLVDLGPYPILGDHLEQTFFVNVSLALDVGGRIDSGDHLRRALARLFRDHPLLSEDEYLDELAGQIEVMSYTDPVSSGLPPAPGDPE
jgi:hypothetical protein